MNLRNARIDVKPAIPGAHGRGRGNLWAVYGGMQTWVFAARSAGEKNEWVLAVDGMFEKGGWDEEEGGGL